MKKKYRRWILSLVPVTGYSKFRKNFFSCFPTERKNFKLFVPFFNWYPYRMYYGVFDKEYYRILEIQELI